MNDEIKKKIDFIKQILNQNELIRCSRYFNDLLDYITNLQQIEQEHKKINGELREENSKLEIALQNIQEDYDRRIKEIDVLKKKLDRRYYKNECKRLEQENERLKEWKKDLLNENIELENIRKEAIEYFKYQLEFLDFEKDIKARMLCSMGIVLLQGSEDNEC